MVTSKDQQPLKTGHIDSERKELHYIAHYINVSVNLFRTSLSGTEGDGYLEVSIHIYYSRGKKEESR